VLAAIGGIINACDAMRLEAGDVSRNRARPGTLALSSRDSCFMAPTLSDHPPPESS
jgi:hypothetical protein